MLCQPSWAGLVSVQLLLIFHATLYLLPGLAIALRLPRLTPVSRSAVILISGAFLGYSSFWLFFVSKLLGKLFTILIFSVCAASVAPKLGKQKDWRFLEPFGFALLAASLSLSVLGLYGAPNEPGAALANDRFFAAHKPGDNLIPLIFAGKIYAHEPVRPFCCGDWLSSDRPPLQAGLTLLVRPLRPWGSLGLQYQVVGTFLQCLWIVGMWNLLSAVGLEQRIIRIVLVLLALTGFTLYNSIYVWPKLLAAALILCAASLLPEFVRSKRASVLELSLFAASIALALLAHGGAIFSIPAIAAALVYCRVRFPFRAVVCAVAVTLILLLPWTAYQKVVDPPGDRLLKMHLAGVSDPDPRPFTTVLADAYERLSLRQILENKLSNVRTVVGPEPDHLFSRRAESEYIWNALGILNAGWILYAFFRRGAPGVMALLLGGAACNLFIWCMLLFGPHGTYTTHASYADILLIAGCSACVLAGMPPIVPIAAALIELLNLVVVWILFPPGGLENASLVPSFALGAGLVLAMLIWIFGRNLPHIAPAAIPSRERELLQFQ